MPMSLYNTPQGIFLRPLSLRMAKPFSPLDFEIGTLMRPMSHCMRIHFSL